MFARATTVARVTPDGQRFVAVVPVPDTTPHPATVILNWRAAISAPQRSQ
jgi:hypothetical protein